MKLKHLVLASAVLAMTGTGFALNATAEGLYIPQLNYRTGAFGGNGSRIANGFTDYLTMINERDGGVGGVKIVTEECETGYNAQKGVECYEATKGKGALVYNPYSTGITLQLIPKAPVDKIPVLSSGYGLSAAAVGEKFPWTFNFPTTYWGQMTAILRYISTKEGGDGTTLDVLKGKKIGFIYLDVGYGREPLPLLDSLSAKYGFEVLKVPVAGKEMQNQSSHWLTVRKEKPDWMIMWGWGVMNATALKAAAKIRYPMDRFIGNWWSSADVDAAPSGMAAKGFTGATYAARGTDFPVIQDVLKHVVRAGKSQVKSEDEVGSVLYNRGLITAAYVVEAIRVAQKMTGKKNITGEDMRLGLENLNLDEKRLAEMGMTGFTLPMKVSCKDHSGGHPLIMHQWDGKTWNPIGQSEVMKDVVRPLIEAAAKKYVDEQKGWQTQTCQ